MKAVRLIGLTACLGALAACSDSLTASVDEAHLAMTRASRDEATRLYNLANSQPSTNVYRPLLLKALVDGLQWGVEMGTISVNIGGSDVTLRAMAMDNIVTNPSSSGGFVMAWSTDQNVNTILIASKPYGAGISVRNTSSAVNAPASIASSWKYIHRFWMCTTHFGIPVVPDVELSR